MSETTNPDQIIIQRIRTGDEQAWRDLIDRYEGRLVAFVESRIGRRKSAEDVVQDTFIGLLNSLPNYDGKRPLESYLFSICSYKLIDHLRHEGKRPTVSLALLDDSQSDAESWNMESSARGASSIARSGERKGLEERAIVLAIRELLQTWREKGEWVKLMCVELLFVRGYTNKSTAELLRISEQHAANYKFEFINKMKNAMKKQQLPEDVFPELRENNS